VTFRVTSRWQNQKTVVNGRKQPKKLEEPKPLIPRRFRQFVRFFADLPKRIARLPLSPPFDSLAVA